MVITLPASQSGNGPRQMNPNKDLPQLIELLRLVFGKELDAEGQQFLRNIPDGTAPPFYWRFDPLLARLSPGYVWEEHGRIVGNATLLPTRTKDRYLVANVAVHPDYRQRGIARVLMGSIEEEVRMRRGNKILLQVDHDNEDAIRLYQSLGYVARGSMAYWRSSVSRVRDLPLENSEHYPYGRAHKLRNNRWKEAYSLDCGALESDLNWPDALQVDAYKKSFWQRTGDFLNGRLQQTWVTLDDEKRMSGLVAVFSEWGRSHQLKLRVHPMAKGKVEWILLQSSIDRLRTLSRRNVLVVHLADDELVNRLLRAASFVRHRTLTHMRLDVIK